MAAAAEALTRRPALAEPRSSKILRVLAKSPVQFALVVLGLLWLVPTFGLLLTSLLSPVDFQVKGWWQVFSMPHKLTWSNYDAIFHNSTILHSLLTTAEIAVGATLLPIFIGALAAYAFAWLEFPGRDWLFILVIALLVVPLQMALIPIFSLYNTVGIYDTVIGLILFHTAFGLPFAVFLLRNFFVGIPKDLIEAARIDGASELYILLAPDPAARFARDRLTRDLPVPLDLERSSRRADPRARDAADYGRNLLAAADVRSNIDIIAPATFVSLVIPLAVFFAFQRYFVQGLLAGSVK
jgi:alpha-glucoside transport system permease protein